MPSINCTFDEFKRMAREFRLALPTLNPAELDNAWKCLGLAYLGMYEPMWQTSAVVLLKMEAREMLAREVELARSSDHPAV